MGVPRERVLHSPCERCLGLGGDCAADAERRADDRTRGSDVARISCQPAAEAAQPPVQQPEAGEQTSVERGILRLQKPDQFRDSI